MTLASYRQGALEAFRVHVSSGWRGGLKPLGTLHGHVSTHLSVHGDS